uniref:Uncharacterized protein n=1 Tax=Sphaerodactylus townsendi TaxID=933632 RepID=A0ACB8EKB7_9SAUR
MFVYMGWDKKDAYQTSMIRTSSLCVSVCLQKVGIWEQGKLDQVYSAGRGPLTPHCLSGESHSCIERAAVCPTGRSILVPYRCLYIFSYGTNSSSREVKKIKCHKNWIWSKYWKIFYLRIPQWISRMEARQLFISKK